MPNETVPPPPPMPLFPSPGSGGDNTQCMKKVVSKHLQKASDNIQPTTAEEECRVVCSRMDKLIPSEDMYYYSFHKVKVPVIIQDGPKCGLVAISMLSQIFNSIPVSPDEMFEEAVSRKYTKQGEMFSGKQLCALAQDRLHCKGELLSGNLLEKMNFIIGHLLHEHFVVVPYDRDHNNEPCYKRGQKAHWAILSGVLVRTNSPPEAGQSTSSQDEQLENLYHTSSSYWGTNSILESFKRNQIFVYANQSKSLRTHLWNLEDLLHSNGQLTELDPEILSCLEDYQIPDGSISNGLNNCVFALF